MSDKHISKFPGDKMDVEWDGRLCIHIGECGRAQGNLFVGGRQPWCQPNLVSSEEAIEVVKRCPTGALTYQAKDGSPAETADDKNTVTIVYNGPLYAKGALEIDGAADDMPGVQFRAALCRCGHSKNKPFCDNSHEEAKFQDYGAVGETGGGIEAEGGSLTIKKAPNGPLLLSGNFTIHAGSGREAWKGTKAALCRCGHSKNKPFCDGSHKPEGFTAD